MKFFLTVIFFCIPVYWSGELRLQAQVEYDSSWLVTPTQSAVPIVYDTMQILPGQTVSRVKDSLNPEAILVPRFNIQGWKSISFTMGEQAQGGLSQSLYLSLEGHLRDQFRITGVVKDNQTPLTEFSEGQKLRSLDQIYFQIDGPRLKLQMGDFFYTPPLTIFLPNQQKLQGIALQLGPYQAMAGRQLGQFTTCRFNGREGNPGPYLLTTENGDPSIIIVPESERVYRNGKLLKTGDDGDYLIDYAAASLTFNISLLVREEDRFYVEFEYTSRYYERYISAAKGEIGHGVSAFGYVAGDQTDRFLLYDLTSTDKDALRSLSPGASELFLPGIRPVNQGEGNYRQEDSAFIYTGPGQGDVQLDFYLTSPGAGDYVYAGNGEFLYVGNGKGSYRIGRKIPTPQQWLFAQTNWRDTIALPVEVSWVYAGYKPNQGIDYRQHGWMTDGRTGAVSGRWRFSWLYKNRWFKSYYPLLTPEETRDFAVSFPVSVMDLLKSTLNFSWDSWNLSQQILSFNQEWTSWRNQIQYHTKKEDRVLECSHAMVFSQSRLNSSENKLLDSWFEWQFNATDGLKGRNEWLKQSGEMTDSSYWISELSAFSLLRLMTGWQENVEIMFRREIWSGESLQNANHWSWSLLQNGHIRKDENCWADYQINWRQKFNGQSGSPDNYFLYHHQFHYQPVIPFFQLTWQKNFNLEDAFQLTKRFQPTSAGNGNYRYDSLMLDYVPDDYGDYILIKEFLKNTQTLSSVQDQLQAVFSPFLKLAAWQAINFSYRHEMEKKVAAHYAFWKNLAFPLTPLNGEVSKLSTRIELKVTVALDSLFYQWHIPSSSCLESGFLSDRQNLAYYLNDAQQYIKHSFFVVFQHPWNAQAYQTWRGEFGRVDREWQRMSALNYEFSEWSSLLDLTWPDLIASEWRLATQRYSLENSRIWSVNSSLRLTPRLKSKWKVAFSYSLDYLQLSQGAYQYHYFLTSGKRLGFNNEATLDVGFAVGQKSELSLRWFRRHYSQLDPQTFLQMSWRAIF